jgi:predicted RNase H-like HicB family nuclease
MRKIVIHRSEPDEDVAYWVECPSLGIASMGDTVEEAIAMMREAIALHIEDLTEHGEPVPPEVPVP